MRLKDALIVAAVVLLALVPKAISYYPGLYATWWVDGGIAFANDGGITSVGANIVEQPGPAGGSTYIETGFFSNYCEVFENDAGVVIGYIDNVGDISLSGGVASHGNVSMTNGNNAITLTAGTGAAAVEGATSAALESYLGPLYYCNLSGCYNKNDAGSTLTVLDTIGDETLDGGLQVQGHVDFTGPKPSIATSRSAPLTGCFDAGAPTLSANSTDTGGVVSITTGSLAAGGCAGTLDIGDITFAGALSAARVSCVVTPDITSTGAGSTIGILPTVALQSYGFSIYTSGITQTPAASTTYSWDYVCVGLH